MLNRTNQIIIFAKITHSALFGGHGGFFYKYMETKERVAIYIDGNNFYHKLKDLKVPNTVNFNYLEFCNKLARGRNVVSYRYYVGAIRAKEGDIKGQQLRTGQLNLFNNLLKQRFTIKKGHFLLNDCKYHEKGVDVKIAVDLLVGAYDDIYDTAILVSSDSDLNPAVKKIKHLGKKLEYIGFSHLPCFALQKDATLSRLLIKDDLDEFIVPSLPLGQ